MRIVEKRLSRFISEIRNEVMCSLSTATADC